MADRFFNVAERVSKGKYSAKDADLSIIISNILQSMDGLQSAEKNKDAGVVVVGATNRVCQLGTLLKTTSNDGIIAV